MEMIEISKLKEHPRNKEFFDDITGERWSSFKESIIRDGVVEPIVVTQDLTIVSGHQRVRACREIGLLDISCRIAYYPDYDSKNNRSKEDMIIENLISTNIMQRGVGNVNPMKMAKCIMELERIKGVRQGGDRKSERHNVGLIVTQDELAEDLNIKPKQMQRYKELIKLIPELQQMVENGSMKATVGYKIWAKMSQEEQEEFFNEIGKEKLKTMTQKATQQYIDENKKLKIELENEKNKPSKVVTQIKEVDNTDYSAISKAKEIQKNYGRVIEERDRLERRLKNAEELADSYKKDSKEYKKMKEEMTYLTEQKDDLGRKIQSMTDISGLIVEIDGFIKDKLAPVKYSRALLESKDEEIVINNVVEIVNVVQSWVDEMKQYIPNKNNFVEVI